MGSNSGDEPMMMRYYVRKVGGITPVTADIPLNGMFLLICLIGGLAAGAHPVAAQDGGAVNPVCQDSSDTLANMIEGFVQVTTGLGIMGLLIVWQAESLAEMFTVGREQKASLKRHKRGAMKSAVTLVVLGPLFTVAGAAMNIPVAQCVDLIPF